MPFASDQQRKFIFAQAGNGKKWAQRFIKKTRAEGNLHVKRFVKGKGKR